ncbi:MAG: cyclopropane-fatty-acyl-phospholipid synthase family protein [Sphingobium sp.]|nr:class I SAM-dependent methyltransferase [Sphingobium sp.]MCP5399341.1 class I SAM-dependent methyltransferase [Sphingomonas sp.]
MNAMNHKRGAHLVRAARWMPSGWARLWGRLLAPFGHRILDRIDAGLDKGRLEAWLPDGSIRVLGARDDGPVCEVRLRNWHALVRLATGGSVGWYQAWAAGEWDSPDPVPLFALFMANARTLGRVARARGPMRWLARMAHGWHANSRTGAKRNISAHYDLGNDFYALWLDEGMNYSSALFADAGDPQEGLEAAQCAKIDAALDRLALKDGDRLLEIGCGWGGFARHAMERSDIRYDGLTLSTEQAQWARSRLPAERAEIHLTDYRDATGAYDAIASIEMVEAVGREYWPDYLAAIHRLLKPGGRAVIQYISIDDAIFERYAASADFIQTYIFPGGMLLSESCFRAIAEAQGLEWRDRHSFGQHYATTLRLWRERFDAALDEGHLPAAFDEKFVKLWRYYLMYCEGGFAGGGIDVAQVTLVKS